MQTIAPEVLKYFVGHIEALRKERSNMDASPVTTNVPDYAAAGNLIDKAIFHLDEALPNGQLIRAGAALVLMKEGVAQLEKWMQDKGYVTEATQLQAWIETGTAIKVVKEGSEVTYVSAPKQPEVV